jgi:hypothetical protein
MKMIFGRELLDFAGAPLQGNGTAVTLKSVALEALLAVIPDEKNLSGEEKAQRYLLAQRIYKGEEEYTVEEIGTIKTLIGKAYGPVVVGAAWGLLENHEKGASK